MKIRTGNAGRVKNKVGDENDGLFTDKHREHLCGLRMFATYLSRKFRSGFFLFRRLGFFLIFETCATNLDFVAVYEPFTRSGFAVDQGRAAEGKVFQFRCNHHNLDGTVTIHFKATPHATHLLVRKHLFDLYFIQSGPPSGGDGIIAC
jgi:hypothetical protein